MRVQTLSLSDVALGLRGPQRAVQSLARRQPNRDDACVDLKKAKARRQRGKGLVRAVQPAKVAAGPCPG